MTPNLALANFNMAVFADTMISLRKAAELLRRDCARVYGLMPSGDLVGGPGHRLVTGGCCAYLRHLFIGGR